MSSASSNEVPDARSRAAEIVRILTRAEQNDPVFCYGTPEKLTIGVGFIDRIVVNGVKWTRDSQHGDHMEGMVVGRFANELEKFLVEHHADVVMGHLGFELNQIHSSKLAVSDLPSSMVFVPKTVLQVSIDGTIDGATGDEILGLENMQSMPPRSVSVAGPPASVMDEYGRKVAEAASWVSQDPSLRRVTVCTSYDPCQPIDFAATICTGYLDDKGLSRTYYIKNGQQVISGTSPELLIEYHYGNLLTHKLSGTFRRAGVETIPDNQERVIAEHRLSAQAMARQLGRLGSVSQSQRFTLALGSLNHFATTFETRINSGASLAAVLLALLPTGAAPVKDGLDLIGRLEEKPRGAYYGLIGICYPDGSAQWSQLLRGVFGNGTAKYISVGSAVTSLSTAAIEQDEIALKVANIRVALNGRQ